jgi:hypothetical protein
MSIGKTLIFDFEKPDFHAVRDLGSGHTNYLILLLMIPQIRPLFGNNYSCMGKKSNLAASAHPSFECLLVPVFPPSSA